MQRAAKQRPAKRSAMRRKATGSIQSNFAILDVKTGRAALHKRFKKRDFFGECPERMRIPVLIRGYIDGIWGGDDGASREFSVVVTSVLETRKRKGA